MQSPQEENGQYVVGGPEPHGRRKVLCLGMSYVDIEGCETVTPIEDNLTIAVRRVIECVRRDYITEMDGRDLARCVATEYQAKADLYTVSQEDGGQYREDRHMNGNFNRTNFVKRLQEHFMCIEFDQIVLDYFWIPAGWDVQHWSRTLFSNTLIELAKQDVLPYRKPLPDELLGSVVLPFCYHCFKEIIGSFKQLRKYYNVSFLRKDELHRVSLWAGTQEIEAKPMQYWLGKRRDQEEVYCTFGPKDVNEAGKDTTVSKQKIVDLARQLEDFNEIRFIVLTRLPPHEAGQKKRKGQWIGLTPKDQVQRGYDSVGLTRQLPPPPHQAKQAEQVKEWKRVMEENTRLPLKKRKVFKMTATYDRRESPKTVLETDSSILAMSSSMDENLEKNND